MSAKRTTWSADAHVRVADYTLRPCRRLPVAARGQQQFAHASSSPSSTRRLKAAGTGCLSAFRLRTWASALLALWVCAATSFAATPALVNSAVTPGGRQTVGTIVVDSAIGGIGGSASVGTVIARHGAAGQLTDLANVAVSASATTVNENATSQLAATAVFTDATVSPLAATSVAWSASGGGLASVSASGLATAATVYQNTNGLARADYLGAFGTLTLSVLNVGTDDFGTYASDGLDDAWQVTHFGVGNANAAATADPDGDGQNNLLEYLAGTTPTSGASLFTVGINAANSQPRTVSFSPLAAGRTYTVEFTTDLRTRIFTALPPESLSEVNSVGYARDATATNAARFYRVRISLP